MVMIYTFLAILFGLSTVLQAAAGNFNSPTSTWSRGTIQSAWKGVSCSYNLHRHILMVVCPSHVKSTVPQVVDPQKALFEAVGRDDAEGIEAAVHLGANLEAKDGEQMTALALAAKEGRERAVSTLIRLGAEVEATAGERGWSPLLWAMVNRQNQAEALLRKAGAKVVDPQKALFEAVDRDDAEGIEAAVHLGANLEAKDGEQMTALALAAKEGRERAVSTLIRLGAEVEAAAGERGWSPLLWAVANRQNQTEALLREAGAKVTKEEAQDLLRKGVEEADRLMIEGALQSGADLKEYAGKKQAMLWEGIKKDDPEEIVCAHLLGADLNARRNLDNMTPLGLAARDDRLEAVKTLLRLGAALGKTGGVWEATPVHFAAYCGHLKVVIELVDAGAKLRIKDTDGDTPHNLAERWKHNATRTYLEAVLFRDFKS